MKKSIFLILAIALATGASAQQHHDHDGHNHGVPAKDPASDPLQLKETEFDFGKIPQGKPVYHTFMVTNIGKEPLVLDNVSASCGCTTPEWSQDPIAPGASAPVKVGYNSAAEGAFDKFITITYNNLSKVVRIKGNVWKAPEGPAPANASLNFLKTQSF